jgi:hypothetical protein
MNIESAYTGEDLEEEVPEAGTNSSELLNGND